MEIDFTKWIGLQDTIHLLRKKIQKAEDVSKRFLTAVLCVTLKQFRSLNK